MNLKFVKTMSYFDHQTRSHCESLFITQYQDEKTPLSFYLRSEILTEIMFIIVPSFNFL